MYKIYLDTTERYKKSVKLVQIEANEQKVIGTLEGDIDIVSAIRELLEINSLKIKDIEIVEPNTGPGSFTGIKLGIVIANILNWSNEKETIFTPNYGQEPNIQAPEIKP